MSRKAVLPGVIGQQKLAADITCCICASLKTPKLPAKNVIKVDVLGENHVKVGREYFAGIFGKLREKSKDDLENSFSPKLQKDMSVTQSGGKGGAFFVKSGDGKFFVKSVSKSESKVLFLYFLLYSFLLPFVSSFTFNFPFILSV